MSDKPDNKKDESPSFTMPDISLKEVVKSGVNVCNKALAGIGDATEGIKQPLKSTWKNVSEESSVVTDKIQYVYQRRHEFAPHIIGTSAVVGAGYFGLRRGRIAGIIGGVALGGVAYGVVYDQFNIDNIPDVLFGSSKK